MCIGGVGRACKRGLNRRVIRRRSSGAMRDECALTGGEGSAKAVAGANSGEWRELIRRMGAGRRGRGCAKGR